VPTKSAERAAVRQVTFGSYNFENGGFDEERRDARLARQLDMLAGAHADAWAFQECKHWAADGYRYLHFAERALGMRGFLARSNHHGCDLAVFVRESAGIAVHAERHEEGPPYWHAVARVEVVVDDWAINLVSAHLAPSSPSLRLIEAEAFALIAKDGFAIAGGGWNALPTTDPVPPIDGIPAERGRSKLDRSAAQALEETGLIDVAAQLGDLSPTVAHTSGLRYRCDRIYTNLSPAAIAGYQVIAEDKPRSDHRPVVGTFVLPD
jgi:hypothetical protein